MKDTLQAELAQCLAKDIDKNIVDVSMEEEIKSLKKDFLSLLQSIKSSHIDGIECNCRLDNRSHEIQTRSCLNDLWTRQKLLEETVKILQDTRITRLESNQLGQQLDPKVWVFVNERLDKLEGKAAHNEALLATISANFVSTKSMEHFVEANVNNIFGQIEGVQHLIEHAQEGVEKCFERIEKLESDHLDKLSPYAYVTLNTKFKELEQHVKAMTEAHLRKVFKNAKPHKCPLCDGKGKLWPEGTIGYDRCEPCEGKGVLWG